MVYHKLQISLVKLNVFSINNFLESYKLTRVNEKKGGKKVLESMECIK